MRIEQAIEDCHRWARDHADQGQALLDDLCRRRNGARLRRSRLGLPRLKRHLPVTDVFRRRRPAIADPSKKPTGEPSRAGFMR